MLASKPDKLSVSLEPHFEDASNTITSASHQALSEETTPALSRGEDQAATVRLVSYNVLMRPMGISSGADGDYKSLRLGALQRTMFDERLHPNPNPNPSLTLILTVTLM